MLKLLFWTVFASLNDQRKIKLDLILIVGLEKRCHFQYYAIAFLHKHCERQLMVKKRIYEVSIHVKQLYGWFQALLHFTLIL